MEGRMDFERVQVLKRGGEGGGVKTDMCGRSHTGKKYLLTWILLKMSSHIRYKNNNKQKY